MSEKTKLAEVVSEMVDGIEDVYGLELKDPQHGEALRECISTQLACLLRGLERFIPPADLGGDIPYGEMLEHYGLQDPE